MSNTSMTIEKSCGAVVFTRESGEVKYVIVREKEGFCSFPKGHMEAGETEHETARREILEETGLSVRFVDGFRTEDSHPHIREGRPDVIKQIVYFLAEYENQVPKPQESELIGIELLTFDEAIAAFQYESSKRILTEAHTFLQKNL